MEYEEQLIQYRHVSNLDQSGWARHTCLEVCIPEQAALVIIAGNQLSARTDDGPDTC